MKLAVFGGSGVIGQVLLPELRRAGHEIRAMRHRAPLSIEDAEVVEGSLADPKAVAETIRGAEVVVQMTKGGAGVEQAVETSAHGTINVLDAVVAAGGAVRQVLLTSSDAATGIWSHPAPEPISHRTPPSSYGGYYSLGKVLEEVILAEYVRNEGLPWTISRLSYVHQEDSVLRLFVAGDDPKRPQRGPFDSEYTDAQKQRLQAGEKFVVLPVDEKGRPLGRTLVQREDVVSAMAAMVGNDRALGERFHVSGPGFRYDQPCEHLAAKLDLPVEPVTVPNAYPFTIDTSRTTEQLGWRPQFDVTAMLDSALAWRREHRAG